MNRRWVSTCGLAVAAVVAFAGCGSSSTPSGPTSVSTGEKLLSIEDLPKEFELSQLSITDLQATNAQMLDQLKTATYEPAQCKPTADDQLNRALAPENGAVLATQGFGGNTLMELVTTEVRDIAADRRVGTGQCQTVTATITTGIRTGTTIATRTELLTPADSKATQTFLAKQTITTTLPGEKPTTATTLVGYALVAGVTVQLIANYAANPMPNNEFVALFGKAIDRAVSGY